VSTEHKPHFDSLVDNYDRYRVGYPPSLFERVLQEVGGRPRILDLATGTGLAARDLAHASSLLVGCDVALMMIKRSRWGSRVIAPAEALPFSDEAFDLVTCAQAFHWMNADVAYREMRRVLTRRGVAALWWKYEAPDDPTSQAADAVYTAITGKPAPKTLLEQSELPAPPAGLFRERQRVDLRFTTRQIVADYVGYHASRENLRQGAGDLRERFLSELRRTLDAMHPTGVCDIAYQARIDFLRVSSSTSPA
jgi:SAM-dependent methyltransferase